MVFMEALKSLSLEISQLRANGQKKIPLELKNKILKYMEEMDDSIESCADVLKLHCTTIHRWKRSLKKVGFSSVPKKNGPIGRKKTQSLPRRAKKEKFVELFPPIKPEIPLIGETYTQKTHESLFIEINLGNGAILRVYR